MGVPVPVTRSNDLSAGSSSHLFLPIPPPPGAPPTLAPAIEIPIPHGWPFGEGVGKVQKTTTVFVNGRNVVLDQHDCGPLIPQITIPPMNSFIPVQLLQSKRAVIVTCFSVRMNGKTTACTSHWPPLPLLTCGQPTSMPATFTFTNLCTNVHVGMSGADLIGGIAQTAATMAIERCFSKPHGVSLTAQEESQKSLYGAAASLLASIVQHAIDPRYPMRVDATTKGPFGTEIKISVSAGSADTRNNPQKISISIQKKVEDQIKSSSVSIGGSGEYTWDAGGDTTKEGLKGQVGLAGTAPGFGAKASAGGEYHPDAPEGQRGKATFKREEATPFESESTQLDYNPGAPEGRGCSSQTETVARTQSGDRRTTAVNNPDGTRTITVVDNNNGKVTLTTRHETGESMALPEPAGSGGSPPRAVGTPASDIWGPPL
ncbi:hypothetical protein [Sorangium cellulosum]|uniref:Uncharacterized protein n=1 Tax=Sorangium cellulosum TaxID=56 RepID=A0A150Q2F0_SORCE|nr:hypothetical protein [Sorangium cellulosum]KYF62090.1 hypothetical protein BE15_24720 [Sorangium cellulosum]